MSFVQSKKNGTGGGISVAVTFNASPTVGNLVVVIFNADASSSAPTSVQDNAGNGAYSQAVHGSDGAGADLYIYAKKITSTAGTFTVTASFAGSNFCNCAIHEYSNISSDTPSATNSNNAASGTPATSNSVSPGVASTIVAGVSTPQQATTIGAPGNSFNQREEDEAFVFNVFQTCDKLGASGSQSTSWTLSPSDGLWVAAIAAFTESGVSTRALAALIATGHGHF